MTLVMFILLILKLIQYTIVTRVNEKLNIIPHIEILRELIKKDRLFEKRSDLVFSIREVEDWLDSEKDNHVGNFIVLRLFSICYL